MLSSRTAQSLYQRSYFLSSTFFDIFLSFPNAFSKAFHPHAVRFPAAFLLVHRFYLAFEELLSCAATYLYYHTFNHCQHLFSIFFIIFSIYFWAGCIWTFKRGFSIHFLFVPVFYPFPPHLPIIQIAFSIPCFPIFPKSFIFHTCALGPKQVY